ncbi:MAG: Uma2 family endonuclease [Deltaproteobacteria bacterium]|nr:Uma2 family endonuclease [Deltaproteobacteria bacterium]
MGEPVERISYAEYLERREASEVRLEWLDGVVYAMSGGTVEHARLSAAAVGELRTALRAHGCAVFSADLAIRVEATDRTTYADAVVVCGPETVSPSDQHAVTNPTIIVEVLSPSTEASDRGEKFRHYQRLESLREYVLISQGDPTIEVFERQGNAWLLRTYGAGDSFVLSSQDVEISVDAIYADARRT